MLPQTIKTMMVSPIARPVPRMILVNNPDRAAGRTISLMVPQRDNERATAPCKYS